MKKHFILIASLFLASALVFANADLEKWKAEVSKYENYVKKFSSNVKKAKSLYSKAKASNNSSQMKKWMNLYKKNQKNLKVAQSRLDNAKAKVAQLSGGGSSGGNTGSGGGGNVTITAEERQMLKEINAKKSKEMDYSKVVTFNVCNDCHGKAVEVWKKTPHFKTFSELHKRKKAKTIIKNMGLKGSIKRNGICAKCHYTQQLNRGKPKPISGISCESCHGPAQDWKDIHNNKNVPRMKRLSDAADKGMNNTIDIYQIAQNCYNCHNIGNEKLVNVGGHKAKSNFEFVRYSQGMIRHNFVRGKNTSNAKTPQNRLRVMYVVGSMLDLEYALRGVGKATNSGKYYKVKMARAKVAYNRLAGMNKAAGGIPEVQNLVNLFNKLNFRNKNHIITAANYITIQARKFTKNHDGSKLAAIDIAIPAEKNYKWKRTPRE